MIVAESYPGYQLHLRQTGEGYAAPNYGGHVSPKPTALCGRELAWDTRIRVEGFGTGRDECSACTALAAERAR